MASSPSSLARRGYLEDLQDLQHPKSLKDPWYNFEFVFFFLPHMDPGSHPPTLSHLGTLNTHTPRALPDLKYLCTARDPPQGLCLFFTHHEQSQDLNAAHPGAWGEHGHQEHGALSPRLSSTSHKAPEVS